VEVRLENCLNVEPIVSSLLVTLEVEAHLEEEAISFKLNHVTPLGTETVREEIDREVGVDM
jgi:hypothetical protein